MEYGLSSGLSFFWFPNYIATGCSYSNIARRVIYINNEFTSIYNYFMTVRLLKGIKGSDK